MKKEIKACFKAWDSDGGGYLDKAEMSQAMEEMGKKPTPEELEALMKEVDLDGNGTVGNLSSFSWHNADFLREMRPCQFALSCSLRDALPDLPVCETS